MQILQTFYRAKANCSWPCIKSKSFHGGIHICISCSSSSCRLDSDIFADYFRLWRLQCSLELDTNIFLLYFSVHTIKDRISNTWPSNHHRCSLEYPPLSFICHILQDREYPVFSDQLVPIYGRECIFCERYVRTQVYLYLRVWYNLCRSDSSWSPWVFILLISIPWVFVQLIFY